MSESLISTLLPLFMSLVEAKKERQKEALALELKKIEGQIQGEANKLAWEKEKTIMTINSEMSLKEATNRGLLDVEKQKNLGAMAVEEIKARTQGATNASIKEWQKYHSDQILEGEKLKAAHTVKGEGENKTSSFDPLAYKRVQDATSRAPITPAEGASVDRTKSGNPLETVRSQANYISGLRAGPGGDAEAESYFKTLSPSLQKDVLEHRGTPQPAAPAGATPAITPVATPALTPIAGASPTVSAEKPSLFQQPSAMGVRILNSPEVAAQNVARERAELEAFKQRQSGGVVAPLAKPTPVIAPAIPSVVAVDPEAEKKKREEDALAAARMSL